MINQIGITQFAFNARAVRSAPTPALVEWLGRTTPGKVRRLLGLCPKHQVTPLLRLDSLARELGTAAIYAKDESNRLGLGSFKALGGAYVAAELVLQWSSEALARDVAPHEILTDPVRKAVQNRTLCCATDGNHGRSVAAGARLFGCKAVIFVHPGVADFQRARLCELGARIVVVPGNYDDSVDACAKAAVSNGWQLVSDTSWDSDQRIPARVMRGYTVLIDEALSQLDTLPTHIFVQGGVGGLAGAVAGYLAVRFGDERPRIVVIEPDRANCLLASARAGLATRVAAGDTTVMAMLECFRPSDTAWPVIERYVDAFLSLSDEAAIAGTRLLANPMGADPIISTSASGGAGMAGLIGALREPRLRCALHLDHQSRILAIITEGNDGSSPDRVEC
jgi:diaminopropionate ammonia-lyase